MPDGSGKDNGQRPVVPGGSVTEIPFEGTPPYLYPPNMLHMNGSTTSLNSGRAGSPYVFPVYPGSVSYTHLTLPTILRV